MWRWALLLFGLGVATVALFLPGADLTPESLRGPLPTWFAVVFLAAAGLEPFEHGVRSLTRIGLVDWPARLLALVFAGSAVVAVLAPLLLWARATWRRWVGRLAVLMPAGWLAPVFLSGQADFLVGWYLFCTGLTLAALAFMPSPTAGDPATERRPRSVEPGKSR